MKLHHLIDILKKIEAEVPFESDVVSGDDWMPDQISRVYHEPPHTFIQFEQSGDYDFDDSGLSRNFTPQEKLLIHAFIEFMFERYKNGEIELLEATSTVTKFCEVAKTCSAESAIALVRSHIIKNK
ncbi:hypothetical protein ACU5B6_25470 [Moritella viscosa]|uniref:hypothetical protein n=1 Tax=Moritella viscosa TaxID=80854 RepID=UPI0009214ABD|nr:hypothetical protein [Moritella viscosa]SHO14281.1 Putative uncharacterized protein [Moritella viscosa]SHO16124.1 Putative uncharacterized protein [Moritella viscosa]SHO18956.1 Putative uncharacterized protein [Moritella viscosa]